MLFFLPFVWWRKHRSCEPKEAVHCDLDLIRSVDGFVTPGELTSGEPLEPR
jgi:hypothetical protein